MLKNDWFMRQINDTCKAIALIIFNKKEPLYEIEDEQKENGADMIFNKLLFLLDENKFNEAENLLFENLNPDVLNYLLVAIDFYNRISQIDEKILEENDFSREEIKMGLDDITNIYNIKF